MSLLCTFSMYGVLFSPLWLKHVQDWPVISVNTWQQLSLGQIVWFGWLSAISQLASRMELGKSVSIALHNLTLPGPGGESREGSCVPSPLANTKENPRGEEDMSSLYFLAVYLDSLLIVVYILAFTSWYTQSHWCLDWQPRQYIDTVGQRRHPLPRYRRSCVKCVVYLYSAASTLPPFLFLPAPMHLVCKVVFLLS